MANQPHARLIRSAAPLFMIACKATGDDVAPGFAPSSYDRDDVVEGQVFGGAPGAAVLACMQVPGVDIGPAELDVLKSFPHPDVLQESKDARHSDAKGYASDFLVILGQDLHFALEKQGDGAFPRHDVDWLIAGVENECVLHRPIPAIGY
jgi:hypothetical protein